MSLKQAGVLAKQLRRHMDCAGNPFLSIISMCCVRGKKKQTAQPSAARGLMRPREADTYV